MRVIKQPKGTGYLAMLALPRSDTRTSEQYLYEPSAVELFSAFIPLSGQDAMTSVSINRAKAEQCREDVHYCSEPLMSRRMRLED